MFVGKTDDTFSFSIVRMSNGEKIWNTEIGGLFFSNQFLQIGTFLPSENIYGFGEQIHTNIKHDLSQYKTWAMFSRDEKTDFVYGTQRNPYGRWGGGRFGKEFFVRPDLRDSGPWAPVLKGPNCVLDPGFVFRPGPRSETRTLDPRPGP